MTGWQIVGIVLLSIIVVPMVLVFLLDAFFLVKKYWRSFLVALAISSLIILGALLVGEVIG